MNSEIEKLIELALADGQITEKERNVIINKAISLGIDQDEVEMIIEGRLHQLNALNSKPTKEKVGNIKTCPACGATVKSMTSACEDCGHEFSNVAANSSIAILLKNLNSLKRRANEYDIDFDQRKAEVINNTAIPNSREDLLEFLAVCTSQADGGLVGKAIAAWNSKGNEALLKSKIVFRDDQKTLKLIEVYEGKLKKSKNKLAYFYIILFAIVIIIFIASRMHLI